MRFPAIYYQEEQPSILYYFGGKLYGNFK